MKKLFNGFKLKNYLLNLLICLMYPIIKSMLSNDKILVFSDTSFIMALVFILGGIVNIFVRSGDFDITAYVASRSFSKNKNKTFDAYKADKQKEREDSFNYLLFVGISVLIISIIASIFA